MPKLEDEEVQKLFEMCLVGLSNVHLKTFSVNLLTMIKKVSITSLSSYQVINFISFRPSGTTPSPTYLQRYQSELTLSFNQN